MREVDDALARAYSQHPRASGDRPATGAVPVVPPAPHVVPRRQPRPAPRVEEAYVSWPALVRMLDESYGERFERLADALTHARDRHHLKLLLFTSGHRAEGRTTLVLTLARVLARRPGRTLVVDADLAGPMIARQLGLKTAVGLDDVILKGSALSDALVEAAGENLTFLSLREPVTSPRAFVAGSAWSCTMARLRREFDLVLIDGGPIFSGLGATSTHRAVDAAVLVHNRAVTTPRALERARTVLERDGVPLLGLAETFVPGS